MALPDGYLLVCEDRRSARVLRALYHAVLEARGEEIPATGLPETRNPDAHPSDEPSFVPTRKVIEQARKRRLWVLGKMREPPSLRGIRPQVHAASLLARALDASLACFVVDEDTADARRHEVREAALGAPASPVGAGVATREIESWLLAVIDDATRGRLRAQLGFDPVGDPRRLTSTAGGERDTKTVFKAAFGNDESALDRLRATPIERLNEVGGPSGLTEMIEDLGRALDALGTQRAPSPA